MTKREVKRERDVKKTIWFNRDELSIIGNKMAQANLTNFSTYARYMLTTGRVVSVDYSELLKLRNEVNKIGTNINQMARYIHLSEEITKEDFQILLEDIESMKKQVSDALTGELALLEELLEKEGKDPLWLLQNTSSQ
ncbi:plasmid mobilization relaxosome protein MobC [Streptococcus suis]